MADNSFETSFGDYSVHVSIADGDVVISFGSPIGGSSLELQIAVYRSASLNLEKGNLVDCKSILRRKVVGEWVIDCIGKGVDAKATYVINGDGLVVESTPTVEEIVDAELSSLDLAEPLSQKPAFMIQVKESGGELVFDASGKPVMRGPVSLKGFRRAARRVFYGSKRAFPAMTTCSCSFYPDELVCLGGVNIPISFVSFY